jgi:hypothetical protein
LVAASVSLIAYFAASRPTRDADFFVSARSDILAVELDCVQELVWDLPPGSIAPQDAPERRVAGAPVSVVLRGGVHARVRVDPQRRWLIDFARSDNLGCNTAAADAIVARLDDRTLAASGTGYVYQSAADIQMAPRPVLLLRGRVVIGDEIPFGSGQWGAVSTPLLHSARIEVRTPDQQTAQRRLIHEEVVDSGGIIDSHGCLDQPSSDCVRSAGSRTNGFIHVVERDGRPGLEAQLVVTGERIGVRQQGGSQRRVLVTYWSKLATSSWLQMSAALLVFVSLLLQLGQALRRRRPQPGGGHDE